MTYPKMYTKDEAEELRWLGKDITLFLRLAALRIEDRPETLPFRPQHGHIVIDWLRFLAVRYANGDEI